MIAITVQNLVKKFGEVVALDGISFRIEPGELFFLLGPSGCGKTTLLRSIAGFYIPEAGKILFGEDDVTNLPPHKRNTGMMFQSYALWPHMTVAKNVAFGLEERRIPRAEINQRVAAALDSVQMGAYAERKIAQLSGGQQQRVALARALVIRPRCVLLDEPLSNLDARLRLEMRSEIRRICKEYGLTAIYVTHDQKEALTISDRMAVMDSGRIAQIGTPEEVYRRPHSRSVAAFIGETNFLEGKIQSVNGREAVVETSEGVFGGFLSDPSWKPLPAECVTLAIRPESWSLKSEVSSMNCLRGRIGASVYLGEIAEYCFSTHSNTFKIYELNPRLAAREQGRECFAVVESHDVVVLKT